jgi:hypothetical protein
MITLSNSNTSTNLKRLQKTAQEVIKTSGENAPGSFVSGAGVTHIAVYPNGSVELKQWNERAERWYAAGYFFTVPGLVSEATTLPVRNIKFED